MRKLRKTIFCSVSKCDSRADRVITNAGGEYWPVCDWCVGVGSAILSMAGKELSILIMPLSLYREKRESFGIEEGQEMGEFKHSYI